jgi:primosomal protein N' (replication factor Y)
VSVGSRVLVPLGKRRVTGVVAGFSPTTSFPQVREILELLDERPILDGPLLALCRWIAKYYLAPLGEVIRTVLPPGLRVESRRWAVALKEEVPIDGELDREVFAEIEGKGKVPLKSLARKYSGTSGRPDRAA